MTAVRMTVRCGMARQSRPCKRGRRCTSIFAAFLHVPALEVARCAAVPLAQWMLQAWPRRSRRPRPRPSPLRTGTRQQRTGTARRTHTTGPPKHATIVPTRDARAADREQQGGPVDADATADRAAARRDRKGSAGDRKHSEDDRDAASSDRVRAAVERANLVVDGLTGAQQRAHGLAELERDVVKARRTGHPFALAFLDVDGLKAINDTRGHAAGDEVLRQVVAVVKTVVRDYDLIIRYGGDEFICGLLDLNLDDAADRFAKATKDLACHGVAFSVGLAALGGNDTLHDLIERADLAMYEQRRSRGSAEGS